MTRDIIGIIGFGQFGRYWADVLKSDYDVLVSDVVDRSEQAANINVTQVELAQLCEQAQTIFLCVPINRFETVVKELPQHIKPGTVVFDTCSVKSHPAQILQQYLGEMEQVELVAAHPMFGPDSGDNGLDGLALMMWPLAVADETYQRWFKYFEGRGLDVVEMTPDEHDRLAASSQSITHYVGRVLGELELTETPIDTTGFKVLRNVINHTCNDTWELFHDLQTYNPYMQDMQLRLESALDKIYGRLLPERASSDELVIGIQGGKGSFNEEACQHYCNSRDEGNIRIEYLYTSENVLSALHRGEIDRGIFAIQNAIGGVVLETIHELSRYRCEIIEIFDIVVDHCILLYPGVNFEEIDRLISHPQALSQCKTTLKTKYPDLELVSGEGELIDQANCAKHLAEGNLPPTTAVLASRVCADLYGLSIYAEGLQDMGDDNLTSFIWAQRNGYFHQPNNQMITSTSMGA